VTFSWTNDKPKLARLHLDNKTVVIEEKRDFYCESILIM
jgi:hypothetical protein